MKLSIPVLFFLIVCSSASAQDTIAPVVELIGDSIVCLEQGDTYSELGYTVSDNSDSFPELTIIIEGNWFGSTDKFGCRSLRYIAEDLSGNRGYTTWRRIIVRPKGDTSACGYSDSFCTRLEAMGLGEEQSLLTRAYIYPNPTQSFTTIYLNNQNLDLFTISVFDIAGRVLQQWNTRAEKVNFNTSELLPGSYLILVSNAEGSKMLRLNVVR